MQRKTKRTRNVRRISCRLLTCILGWFLTYVSCRASERGFRAGKFPRGKCKNFVFRETTLGTSTLFFRRGTLKCTGEKFGRLGNQLMIITNMINFAEKNCCNVLVDEDMVPGWNPASLFLRRVSMCDAAHAEIVTCTPKSRFDWFFQGLDPPNFLPVQLGDCALQSLKTYFKIDERGALGKQCPTSPHAALHVRAGDIVAGTYDSISGTYHPSPGVHPDYWVYPTSYYTSAIREIRRQSDKKIYVICENMDNPSCEFLAKISGVYTNIEFRVGRDLIDDLHILLCASEVATSFGSFQLIFGLSEKIEKLHTFVLEEPPDKNCLPHLSSSFYNNLVVPQAVFHWITDSAERKLFSQAVKPWHNTALQRHIIDANRSITSCSSRILP